MANNRLIAYFSMEVALHPDIPTYSGGLGMLAGDTLRSAADLGLPMVAVSLIHRKGYFFQRLDVSGWQTEEPAAWVVEDFLKELPGRVSVQIEGREVRLRVWQYDVVGVKGATVPVYLLDADLPENSEWDRTLTHYLYGGDKHYRLCQEVILGIGGVRALRMLGHGTLERFHMNEGHAALLSLELLNEHAHAEGRTTFSAADVEYIREMCVFTTHTPVPAGQDQFPWEMAMRVLGQPDVEGMKDLFCCDNVHCENLLNMTFLALNVSHYINGVAKKHAEVSRHMFAEYHIDAITNGVHAQTWISPPFQQLFNTHIPGWREDNFSLRYALSIPPEEVWAAHAENKRLLIEQINRETNAGLDTNVFTIGFARRAATYKRADLLLHDIEKLKAIAAKVGNIQIIYAGKAHPQDQPGKEFIQRIIRAESALKPQIRMVYLVNYDWELGQLMTAGVDLWLNTPLPPMEASGTSGMKAAMNGVPSLSILDGWWIEGCIEGVTGWAIDAGNPETTEHRTPADADSLYRQLEETIIPLFYGNRAQFIAIMRHAIALNGSFFNTQRMVMQYVSNAYFG
ncbi:MAG: alpha-glucan family phosphorylase [Kiritimatiellales bacterium]|nr:alpha-glucan family phosphorylase [Kiritimatiellales bacterium]MCF7864281.1 alpha-glucan family phosphorylase [Kiritimatiellales bacterium]